MDNGALQIYASVESLQEAAARQIAEALRPTTQGRMMTLALSGGSTPRRVHEILATLPNVDWSNVRIFWGDERTVPPEHEECNYRMARETLLDRVPIPKSQIYRMAGEKDPPEAAEEYQRTIGNVFGVSSPDVPRFDVVVLGMGADGHTASLFPGTSALDERERYVVANSVPQLGTDRLTLTFPVLNAAHLVLFIVAGADKAEAVERCFMGTGDIPPAGRVRPTSGELRWLLDSQAAARLQDVDEMRRNLSEPSEASASHWKPR